MMQKITKTMNEKPCSTATNVSSQGEDLNTDVGANALEYITVSGCNECFARYSKLYRKISNNMFRQYSRNHI